MSPLIIEATETSPKVVFDPSKGIFEMSGESRPENADKFYGPILKWMEDFGKEIIPNASLIKKIKFDLRLEYYNTSSSKLLLTFLSLLKGIKEKNVAMDINWHYDKHDLDMKEAGEEFQRLLNMPIILIPSAS